MVRIFRHLPKIQAFRRQLSPLFKRHPVGTLIAFLELVEGDSHPAIFKREEMLKITRAANGGVIFTVSGRMDAENLGELKKLLISEVRGRCISLDLKELTLVSHRPRKVTASWSTDNIQLKNCPAYIREWITRERGQK
jgi:hypothetical protein